MSKMDDLRKMREARYEAAAARAKQSAPKAGTAAKAERPPVAPVKKRATTKARPATPSEASPSVSADEQGTSEELCGHRNMSGRTCTREKGHAAKSHRYS